IFAAGRLREFDRRLRAMSRRDFLRLLDPGWRRSGVLGGARLVAAMREVVGDPLIEALPVAFTAVAVDLERQREVWIREGRLWDALRASFAIPGLFTPHRVNGRALVDGGLLAPLPIAATRLSDAHRLVAVDMHGWPRRPPGEPARAQPEDGGPTITSRLGQWLERAAGGDDGDAMRTGPRAAGGRRAHDHQPARPMARACGRRRRGRCHAHGPARDHGALAGHDAGADLARAAGAGSARAADPDPARRVLVLRVLARGRADRCRPGGRDQGAGRRRLLSAARRRSP